MEEVHIAHLEQVPLFAGCSEEVLTSLAKPLKPRSAHKGEEIVRRGEVAHEMFFIIKGRVSVIAGNGALIADLGAGSFFGEMGLLYSLPRQASVIALTECDLYVLSKDDFEKVKDKHPEIVKKVRQIADKRFEWFKNSLKHDSVDPNAFTEEQINNFRQVFIDVDLDGSGVIEIDELGKLLHKLSGKHFSQSELELIMQKMDIDKNKSIDFDEFLAGLRHLRWLVGEKESKTKQRSSSTNHLTGIIVVGGVVVAGIVCAFAYRTWFSAPT